MREGLAVAEAMSKQRNWEARAGKQRTLFLH